MKFKLNKNKIFRLRSRQAGFSLIELIVAVAVFGILASGVIYVVTNSYTNFYGTGDKQSLAEFAQEGLEATRSIRESSWQYIENNLDANLGIAKNANDVWEFAGSSNTFGDLTRVITIASVSRDSNGEVVASGGVDDPMTKKVTVTVSGAGIQDYVLNSYLTHWANRIWEQTDWSGSDGTEFWSYEDQVNSSSSIDGVSTAGQLALSFAAIHGWAWGDDLVEIASTSWSCYAYNGVVDDTNDYFYWTDGISTTRQYDISDIRGAGWGSYNSVSSYGYGSALNPVYPHYYNAYTIGTIRTISTSTFAVLQTFVGPKGSTNLYGIEVHDDGTHMYAYGASGQVWSLDIAADGTLTCTNCDSKTFLPQVFASANINEGWLDDANDKLYLVTDDSSNAIMRLDVSDPSKLTKDYAYTWNYDMLDIERIGNNPDGEHRFIIGLDPSSTYHEFWLLDDNPDSSTFTKVASVDLNDVTSGTYVYARDIAYTNYGEAIVMGIVSTGDVKLGFYQISGVTTATTPTLSIDMYDESTYGYYYIYYHPMSYSSKHRGIFAGGITNSGSSSRFGGFLDQEFVVVGGVYAASGTMSSSKLDIGSSNQELHSVTISQNVPSGCNIDVTLYADDDKDFGSAANQVFSSTTASTWTEEVDNDMQGVRWLYYEVDMDACDSNESTPTLYSFRLNYS
jgi:prepilin-type N-terminal cleavage/methylation domain-containing protein